MANFNIKTCPTCGKKNVKRIRKNWKGSYKGREYVVPDLTLYQCPDCGEQMFDHDAMQKIERYSPAYEKMRAAKKAAV